MIFPHQVLLLQPVGVFGMYALKITLCCLFHENIPYIGQYISQGRPDLRWEFQCKAGRSFLLEPTQTVPLWELKAKPRGWVGDCNQRGILRHVWNWPHLLPSEGLLLCVKSEEQSSATLNIWMLHHICQGSPTLPSAAAQTRSSSLQYSDTMVAIYSRINASVPVGQRSYEKYTQYTHF